MNNTEKCLVGAMILIWVMVLFVGLNVAANAQSLIPEEEYTLEYKTSDGWPGGMKYDGIVMEVDGYKLTCYWDCNHIIIKQNERIIELLEELNRNG